MKYYEVKMWNMTSDEIIYKVFAREWASDARRDMLRWSLRNGFRDTTNPYTIEVRALEKPELSAEPW